MELGLQDGHCYHEARKSCTAPRRQSTEAAWNWGCMTGTAIMRPANAAKYLDCTALQVQSTQAAWR
eukprot:1157413-Pelagomonas_calceolata.AAC.3